MVLPEGACLARPSPPSRYGSREDAESGEVGSRGGVDAESWRGEVSGGVFAETILGVALSCKSW